jgi:hypothetical protein
MRVGFFILCLLTGFLPALFLWFIAPKKRNRQRPPGIIESFKKAYNEQTPGDAGSQTETNTPQGQ